MSETNTSPPKASADTVSDQSCGEFFAEVEIGASPERVFRALTSREICQWWVRPGVFNTREWRGEVRVGGRWEASGIGNGREYCLEGEFVEVERPNKLAHTWQPVGAPAPETLVTYKLERHGDRTRLTLHHSGFISSEVSANTGLGWETSLRRLAELLAEERSGADYGL